MLTALPAVRVFTGHTVHQRSRPFTHRFKYDLALIDLDIDRLEEAHLQSGLFNVDRPGLFSFRQEDHGARSETSLREWALEQFAQADVDLSDGTIRLITFPRHTFYKFAPISLWLGHDPTGRLTGILYEVNNTFGETHVYAAAISDETEIRHDADKRFHVSPFFDVSGRYQFTLTWKDDILKLVVATKHGDDQTHVATISALAKPATSATFLKLAISKPISSLGVTFAIHWQALKLWIKGAKYHSKPKQLPVRITTATPRRAASNKPSHRETIA